MTKMNIEWIQLNGWSNLHIYIREHGFIETIFEVKDNGDYVVDTFFFDNIDGMQHCRVFIMPHGVSGDCSKNGEVLAKLIRGLPEGSKDGKRRAREQKRIYYRLKSFGVVDCYRIPNLFG